MISLRRQHERSLRPAAGWPALHVLLAVATFSPRGTGEVQPEAAAWRIANADEVAAAWRVRSLQLFSDDACATPLQAFPGKTGVALATEAAEMTGVAYAFDIRSPRGWESAEACSARECHLGFQWNESLVAVRCLILVQGAEPGFYAKAVTLQRRVGGRKEWADVVTWRPVPSGRAKLALACTAPPAVDNAQVRDCRNESARSQECAVQCDDGYGTVEPRLRCIQGAWYVPECLRTGSVIRLVARAPELIKPFWVILDAALYASADCTDVIRMDGTAISSGEYVIKYATYQPQNGWDGDAQTSWASKDPCKPGTCYLGFRFKEPPAKIACARVVHPEGSQYQATQVSVEQLGAQGWEVMPDVTVRLLPAPRNQEL